MRREAPAWVGVVARDLHVVGPREPRLGEGGWRLGLGLGVGVRVGVEVRRCGQCVGSACGAR